MQMKTGVEQSVYAILILNMLLDKAGITWRSDQPTIGRLPNVFSEIIEKVSQCGPDYFNGRGKGRI